MGRNGYADTIDLRDLADEARELFDSTMGTCPDCKGEGTVEVAFSTDPDVPGGSTVYCEACDGEGERRSLDFCEDADRLRELVELATSVANVAVNLDEDPLGEWEQRIDDLKSYAENEPVAVPESDFAAYAEELADELGYLGDQAQNWPFNHIDWQRAADELQQDYTSFDWCGTTYLTRSY